MGCLFISGSHEGPLTVSCFWRFCRHWAVWMQQMLRTWRKIKEQRTWKEFVRVRSEWWEPHRNVAHRALCWPQWGPQLYASGMETWGFPTLTACTLLLLPWVCGYPGTFPTWGTVWNSQVEHRVLSPGRGEASEPRHSPSAYPFSDSSSVSGKYFPLLVSGTSSTWYAETLIVPNPQKIFLWPTKSSSFFLDGEDFIFLSSQEARENISIYSISHITNYYSI